MQSVLKHCCQSNYCGRAFVLVTSHGQMARFAEGVKILVDLKKIKKINPGWNFIIIWWLCTHTANTHFSSNDL